jgi:hypothetical protein
MVLFTVGQPTPVNSTITLMDYDPEWPFLFQSEADRVRDALGDRVLRIEPLRLDVRSGSCGQADHRYCGCDGYGIRICSPDFCIESSHRPVMQFNRGVRHVLHQFQ